MREMNADELHAPCQASSLPFYTTNESLERLANQWNIESDVSLVQHQAERAYLRQISHQKPPIVVLGAEESLLERQVIARVAALVTRPVIVAVVESTDESILTACYQQGADRVIAAPYCSARIFNALIAGLHTRDICCPPYRFSTGTQTCSIGDRAVRLTAKTYDVALYLFKNQGKLIPKSTILLDVWGIESNVCATRRIEVHMSHIRRQLSLDGSFGWEVRSRRKTGYGIFPITRDTVAEN